MRLYLIRHAQSVNNALNHNTYHLRVPDPPLTELGEQQTQMLADHIHKVQANGSGGVYNFSHIYVSAMRRSMQTAKPLGEALQLDPEVWVDLHENGGVFKNHGEKIVGYTGMTRDEIRHEFSRYRLTNGVTEAGWYDHKKGIETEIDSQFRALKVAHTLRERLHTDDNVAIVSHFAFIDTLLKAFFRRLPTRKYEPQYYHSNTAITQIEFRDDEPILVYLNRLDHLPYDYQSH